jgi:hypothetical protein
MSILRQTAQGRGKIGLEAQNLSAKSEFFDGPERSAVES